jgi:hypothetical protein
VPNLIDALAGATPRSNTDAYDTAMPPVPIGPRWMIMRPFVAKAIGVVDKASYPFGKPA